jgi:uridine kinase
MNGSVCTLSFSSQTLNILTEQVRAIQAINQREGQNTIVCIAGGSSTGKSTQVAQELLARLQPDAQLIGQDNFQLGRDYVNQSDSVYGWDAPANFGLPESRHLLETLRRNQPAEQPDYSFTEARRTGTRLVEPSPIVLFEGLYAGFGELRNEADLLIYTEAPLMARLLKRLFRSCFERYRADPSPVLRSMATGGVWKAHRDLVIQQGSSADVILQMPYRFADTITRFGLTAISRTHSPETVLFSAPIDDESALQIGNGPRKAGDGQGGQHLCLVHQSRLYFTCPVDNETVNWLATTDLGAY